LEIIIVIHALNDPAGPVRRTLSLNFTMEESS